MFLRAIKLDMLEICSRKNKDAIMLKKKKPHYRCYCICNGKEPTRLTSFKKDELVEKKILIQR